MFFSSPLWPVLLAPAMFFLHVLSEIITGGKLNDMCNRYWQHEKIIKMLEKPPYAERGLTAEQKKEVASGYLSQSKCRHDWLIASIMKAFIWSFSVTIPLFYMVMLNADERGGWILVSSYAINTAIKTVFVTRTANRTGEGMLIEQTVCIIQMLATLILFIAVPRPMPEIPDIQQMPAW